MTLLQSRREFLVKSSGVAAALAAPAFVSASALGAAADYPTHELTWIVHQAPGGLIDNTTRVLQPHLASQGFKSTIEYARGASGRIARAKLFRSKPDGYSIMTDTIPDGAIGELVYAGQYKMAEYQPIVGWYLNSFSLVVPANSPFKTAEDFMKAAKSRRVTMATIGKGGASHLQVAMFKNMHKLNLQLVHFDGGAPALAAVLGGHVEIGISGSVGVAGNDSVRSIAVFNDQRETLLPNVGTITEQGYAVPTMNQIVYANTGPGVPADRLAKLRQAFTQALADPANLEQQKKVHVSVKMIPGDEMQKISERALSIVAEYKAELGD